MQLKWELQTGYVYPLTKTRKKNYAWFLLTSFTCEHSVQLQSPISHKVWCFRGSNMKKTNLALIKCAMNVSQPVQEHDIHITQTTRLSLHYSVLPDYYGVNSWRISIASAQSKYLNTTHICALIEFLETFMPFSISINGSSVVLGQWALLLRVFSQWISAQVLDFFWESTKPLPVEFHKADPGTTLHRDGNTHNAPGSFS